MDPKYRYSKRTLERVSYIPREVETLWSLLLGVWVASIVGKDLLVPGFGAFRNTIEVFGVVLTVTLLLVLSSIGFQKGSQTGSFKVYCGIVMVSIMASMLLMCHYLMTLNIKEITDILGLLFRFKLFSGFSLTMLFFGLAVLIIFRSLPSRGRAVVSPRETSGVGIAIGFLLLGIVLTVAFYSRASMLQFPSIVKIIEIIGSRNDIRDVAFNKLAVILLINVVVITRMMVTESFYWVGTWPIFRNRRL